MRYLAAVVVLLLLAFVLLFVFAPVAQTRALCDAACREMEQRTGHGCDYPACGALLDCCTVDKASECTTFAELDAAIERDCVPNGQEQCRTACSVLGGLAAEETDMCSNTFCRAHETVICGAACNLHSTGACTTATDLQTAINGGCEFADTACVAACRDLDARYGLACSTAGCLTQQVIRDECDKTVDMTITTTRSDKPAYLGVQGNEVVTSADPGTITASTNCWAMQTMTSHTGAKVERLKNTCVGLCVYAHENITSTYMRLDGCDPDNPKQDITYAGNQLRSNGGCYTARNTATGGRVQAVALYDGCRPAEAPLNIFHMS